MSSKSNTHKDHLTKFRGNPNISTSGAATFALGRLADAPLQYAIFTQGWAVKGLVAVGLRASNLLVTAGPGVAGLGPIPTLLTGMYAVSALRHGYWVMFTNNFYWPPDLSLKLIGYNTLVNTFNTVVAVHALTSSPYPILGSFTDCIGWKQWTGLALFASGILVETIAEERRKSFKKDPKNTGKIDDTGLWSVVRHPNYLGYLLWRVGITLTTGSLVATAAFSCWQLAAFYGNSIPGISSYMATKYGPQWEDYKRRVPSTIIPGIL
ncbi:hypothetical protein C8R45DRAFT_1025917 [Mycena sanguinolenta]|nr:hypothetical protein C8R45DRAFT_1025917 [Mycena sanguinolenta]